MSIEHVKEVQESSAEKQEAKKSVPRARPAITPQFGTKSTSFMSKNCQSSQIQSSRGIIDMTGADNAVTICAGSLRSCGSKQSNILLDCCRGRNGSDATDADTIIL
jgi:hypothetical protein